MPLAQGSVWPLGPRCLQGCRPILPLSPGPSWCPERPSPRPPPEPLRGKELTLSLDPMRKVTQVSKRNSRKMTQVTFPKLSLYTQGPGLRLPQPGSSTAAAAGKRLFLLLQAPGCNSWAPPSTSPPRSGRCHWA